MNDVSLNPEIVELEAEMEYEMPQYPVIPNPEGEPTEEITKMEIDDVIYEVADAEARATLPTKVDKVEGKGLSTNDYTDTDKAIVDGVTSALDGKVDKVPGKGLSTNDFTDAEKAIVDGTPSALELKADKSDTYTKSEVNSALDNKVDKVEGKGLSANDFTDTLKTKLDGIEAEANKTVVDNSVTSTSTNPVESKAIYNLLNDLLPEATATGNPIAITNASGLNAKSLKVELEPIQDLHGYDSPWVGGGGKNKCRYPFTDGSSKSASGVTYTVDSKGIINVNATATANVDYYLFGGASDYVSLGLPNGEYTFSLTADQYLTEAGLQFFLIDTNGIIFSTNITQAYSKNVTIDSTKGYRLFLRVLSGASISNHKIKIQIESGSTASAWQPYSNICPISGRTQTTVSVNSEDTTVQFGQTVYGGEVDVVNGGTSSEWGFITFDGSSDENWAITLTGRFYIEMLGYKKVNGITCVCSTFNSQNNYQLQASEVNDGCCAFSLVADQNRFACYISSITSVESFRTFLSSNPLQLSYKLATPTTINTPANEISLNKANNTLTADGDMELIYSKTPQ